MDLHEGIDFAIYLTGRFEHRMVKAIAAFVGPGDTVIDIGANIGAHTLPLAKLVGPKGRILAFEPMQFALRKLLANVALNPALSPQITVNQTMLVDDSDAAPEADLYSSWPLAENEQDHSKHVGRAMSTEGATAARLSEYLELEKIESVKLVKLDTDGLEVEVLRGGSDFLKRKKPIIVMELAPYTLAEHGKSLEELLEIVDDTGYGLTNEATGKFLSRHPAALRSLVPDGGSINVVAEPV